MDRFDKLISATRSLEPITARSSNDMTIIFTILHTPAFLKQFFELVGLPDISNISAFQQLDNTFESPQPGSIVRYITDPASLNSITITASEYAKSQRYGGTPWRHPHLILYFSPLIDWYTVNASLSIDYDIDIPEAVNSFYSDDDFSAIPSGFYFHITCMSSYRYCFHQYPVSLSAVNLYFDTFPQKLPYTTLTGFSEAGTDGNFDINLYFPKNAIEGNTLFDVPDLCFDWCKKHIKLY